MRVRVPTCMHSAEARKEGPLAFRGSGGSTLASSTPPVFCLPQLALSAPPPVSCAAACSECAHRLFAVWCGWAEYILYILECTIKYIYHMCLRRVGGIYCKTTRKISSYQRDQPHNIEIIMYLRTADRLSPRFFWPIRYRQKIRTFESINKNS